MENFIDINRKINKLKEKFKNVDDYKTFKQLFEEIANGTMSITFNFFSSGLSFCLLNFKIRKDFLNNRWKSRMKLMNLNL